MFGIGGSLTMCTAKYSEKTGTHIDSNTGKLDFYYVNTKNIHLSNEELLEEFNKIYYNSDILQKEWKDVYPILSDFILKYGDQLDQEEILDTLPYLKFEYKNGFKNRIPLGMYDFENNTICYDDYIDKMDEEEALEMAIRECRINK